MSDRDAVVDTGHKNTTVDKIETNYTHYKLITTCHKMNPNFHKPKLSTPKYYCPVCDRSPKTKKNWIEHLNCELHRKRRKAFLDNRKDEMAILTARIEDDLEKLKQLKGERKQVKKLKVTE